MNRNNYSLGIPFQSQLVTVSFVTIIFRVFRAFRYWVEPMGIHMKAIVLNMAAMRIKRRMFLVAHDPCAVAETVIDPDLAGQLCSNGYNTSPGRGRASTLRPLPSK